MQSLHTTVLPIGTTQDLFPVEVQIRTAEMHREAEFGVAGVRSTSAQADLCFAAVSECMQLCSAADNLSNLNPAWLCR